MVGRSVRANQCQHINEPLVFAEQWKIDILEELMLRQRIRITLCSELIHKYRGFCGRGLFYMQ